MSATTPSKSLSKRSLGLLLIFLTAIIWIATSFISESLVSSKHTGDAPKVPAFLLTYLATSLFTLYLPFIHVKAWIQSCWKHRAARRPYAPVSMSDSLPHSSDSQHPPRSAAHKSDLLERPASSAMQLTGSQQAMSAALWSTPLWFFAQYTFNASLALTSVTSNTILSSTSSLFTFGLSVLLLGEKFTMRKLACILACMLGTVLVTLSDVEAAGAMAPSPPQVAWHGPAPPEATVHSRTLQQLDSAWAALGGQDATAAGGSWWARSEDVSSDPLQHSRQLSESVGGSVGQWVRGALQLGSASHLLGHAACTHQSALSQRSNQRHVNWSCLQAVKATWRWLSQLGRQHCDGSQQGRTEGSGCLQLGQRQAGGLQCSSSSHSSSDSGSSVLGSRRMVKEVTAKSAAPLWGDLLVLMSSALYGGYTVVMRLRLPGDDAEELVAPFFGFVGLFTTVGLAPVVVLLVSTKVFNLSQIPRDVYWIILLEGLLDYVLSDYLWARAVMLVGPTVATLSLSVQIPLAVTIELLSGSPPGWTHHASTIMMTLAGTLLILVGFVGINLEGSKEQREAAAAEAAHANSDSSGSHHAQNGGDLVLPRTSSSGHDGSPSPVHEWLARWQTFWLHAWRGMRSAGSSASRGGSGRSSRIMEAKDKDSGDEEWLVASRDGNRRLHELEAAET